MTAICVVSGLGILFTIPLIFSEAAAQHRAWCPPFPSRQRRCRRCLYCGLLANAPMGSVPLHWGVVSDPNCSVGDGGMEYRSALIPLVVVIIGFIYLPRVELTQLSAF
jgi:hypothetical protein